MKNYQIKWILKSALSTELESDTIFGHFCWNLLYKKGEDRLKLFLEQLIKREKHFVLSNAFQDKRLSMPKLPLSRDVIKRLEAVCGFSYDEKRKEIKKMKSINLDLLKQYSNDFSNEKLIHDHYKQQINLLPDSQSSGQLNIITHNTINRLTGTTSADMENLYQEHTRFYEENTEFYSWLKTDCFDLSDLQEIFSSMSHYGFGKNKHTGKGHFDIEVSECGELTDCKEDANAWLLLSNCVPSESDTTHVLYSSKVKFAKLGGYLALKESPFKHPVFMFTPGSVFFGNEAPQGTILQNVHPFQPEVVQNLCAYVIPLKLESETLLRASSLQEDYKQDVCSTEEESYKQDACRTEY